jgi:phage terminase small subunit
MGELSNARHERFAQELAAGNPADAAYKAAGYQKHRGNAARLSANEHVKDRVKDGSMAGEGGPAQHWHDQHRLAGELGR